MSNKVSWPERIIGKGSRGSGGQGVRGGGGDARGSMGVGSSTGDQAPLGLRHALDVADHLEGRPAVARRCCIPAFVTVSKTALPSRRAHPYPRGAGTPSSRAVTQGSSSSTTRLRIHNTDPLIPMIYPYCDGITAELRR
jgi:hypothetical protein